MCRESAIVDESKLNSCTNSILKSVLSNNKSSDIYNLDETGLFFRLQPDKGLFFCQKNYSRGMNSKERLAVLLSLNILRIDKIKPIVNERNLTPQCFSNVKFFQVIYKTNSKVWMTSTIWEATMKILGKKF